MKIFEQEIAHPFCYETMIHLHEIKWFGYKIKAQSGTLRSGKKRRRKNWNVEQERAKFDITAYKIQSKLP